MFQKKYRKIPQNKFNIKTNAYFLIFYKIKSVGKDKDLEK